MAGWGLSQYQIIGFQEVLHSSGKWLLSTRWHGNRISDDLLTRAADVCLKEKRPLVLVPREMPWNLIMLRNLTQLAEAGATILPACPAWYYKPQTLEDVADTVVSRILQSLGVEQNLVREWMIPDLT